MALRHRRREHQRAAIGRRGGEDEFEVFAKAEIEHLVGLVEHDGAELGYVERAAGDVIAQPAGRADDDMRAAFERPAFRAHVHAADAGADARAGIRRRAIRARGCTCTASSRVGAMTSASGAPGASKRSAPSSSVGAMARPKATVLPEPVCAETRRSAPSASGASTAVWTAVSVS